MSRICFRGDKKAHVRNPAQPEWLMSRFSNFFIAVQVRMVLVLM